MVNDHTMCWMNFGESPPAKIDNFGGKLKKFLKGTKPDVPSLAQVTRYNLLPCPVKGAVASAHVFYKRPGDVQLSMYFAQQPGWSKELPDAPQQARIDAVEIDGKVYQVASWQHKGMVTGLVAAISRQEMKSLAESTRYDAKGQARVPGARLVALHDH
jgi:hypothetical protein